MNGTLALNGLRLVWGLVLAAASLTGTTYAQLSTDDVAALRKRAAAEGWTFTVAENDVTGIPLEQLCGLVEPPDWRRTGQFDNLPVQRDLPASFDWRTLGGCTPIRNQGGCGSCWAFSAIGAMECAIRIRDAVSTNLSEQWLVSCTAAGDCSGGWHTDALQYLRCNGLQDPCGDSGAVLETSFPYVAYNAPCNCPYEHPYCLDSWYYVGPSSGVPTVAQLKQAIWEHGPVAVGVHVNDAFQAYDTGIFNACADGALNHAVVLVGWDDNQGPAGIWFLRNSWGTWWGESGYMRIPYECCRVGYAAAYVNYSPRHIVTTVSNVTIFESGTATFGVKLDANPGGTLAVSVARASGSNNVTVVAGANLTFSATNWDTYQYVTLAAAHDEDTYDATAVVHCSANAWAPADVSVAERDDERRLSWLDKSPAPHPAPRAGHALAFDSGRGLSVLFGGVDGATRWDDTWEWDGSAWAPRGTPGPSARAYHALAYDNARGVTVLFGGDNGSAWLGDTWEWDGTAWAQRAASGPAARANHALAYDSNRGVVVLFGGDNGGTRFSDTWEWNGATWTQRATTGPTARTGHALAFDSNRGRTVLFGGFDGGTVLGDTWEWNGSTWMNTGAGGPAARQKHALAYDGVHGVVVLYGGAPAGGGVYDDTWHWNGYAWSPVTVAGAPGRAAYALAYDSARAMGVLFGGDDGSLRLADTWEFGGHLPVVLLQPVDTVACQSEPATFSVVAEGNPPLSYRWRRNGLPLFNSSRISGADTDTLTIQWVYGTDAGNYDVVVTNPAGAVASDTAVLTICVVGDLNCDGGIGFDDINPFVLRLATPAQYELLYPDCPDENGDINRDGTVGFRDINPFVELLSGA